VKISVVTPSYNQLEYLRLCAASVADQTGVEVEHIVQDAGTPGDPPAWIRDLKQLRFFAEKDAGMYDAINRGLERATGEICAYLNCDEQYLPGALAKVANFFAAQPEVDVLFGDVVLIDANGEPLSYRRVILPTRRHVRLVHLNTATCATFFRRRLLEQGHYFNTKWKVIGDAVWMDGLLEKKARMAVMREPLSVFTFTGENLGESPRSVSEANEWRNGLRFSCCGRLAESVRHRLRKLLAGAYFPRRTAIDVFTLELPRQRQHHQARVGFRWPKTNPQSS
jgi:glycosyltransferase involved in cell wall biosynthesis